MDAKQWKQINNIVDAALELDHEERMVYVNKQCRDNQELKTYVTELLESIEASKSTGFLENQNEYPQHLAADISRSEEEEEEPSSLVGETIGRYKILEVIGHGGMGSVFRAERTDGAYSNQVALKLMRRGMDTPSNKARFRQERNILANLNHPNIGRLYDGGITDQGLPFLVMEYVEGIPLFEYCKKHRLTVDQRLSLFKQVCEAVRHAHQNAVIHRDLKPSNILVTARKNSFTVKVLDFGIAKLMEPDQLNTTIYQTRTGTRPVTLGYAAPEQLELTPTTTATDIYTLGVILYELISGLKPFQLDEKNLTEIEQIIRRTTPERPSTQFCSLPKQEQQNICRNFDTAANGLENTLKGDLDAIVMKAMRKKGDERYNSVDSLLDDLHRRERDLPLIARRDTFRYNASKFIRRNRAKLSVAAGFLAIIIAFSVFYSWQITEERNKARTEAEKAQAVSSYLISLFESADPRINRGKDITARQLLKEGTEDIAALNSQPAVQARMLEILGDIHSTLSSPEQADSLLRRSLTLKKQLYNSNDPELASIYVKMAENKHVMGEYKKSLRYLDTAQVQQSSVFGSRSLEVGKTLRLQSENLREVGKLDSAYKTIQKAKSIYQTEGDTLSEGYLKVLMEISSVLNSKGNFKASLEAEQQSLALGQRLYDPPHPDILQCMNGLARAYKELNQYKKADSLYHRSLAMTKVLHGEVHVQTAVTINNMAGNYFYMKRYPKADSLYSESHSILTKAVGAEHPYTVSTLYNWANLKSAMGDYDGAEKIYKDVIQLDIKKFGEEHRYVATDYAGLADMYREQGKYQQALEMFNKSIDIRRTVFDDPHHPYIGFNLRSLANIYAALGEKEKATEKFVEALKTLIISYDK